MDLKEKIKTLLDEIRQAKGDPNGPILITRYGRKFEQEFLGFTLPDQVDLFFQPEEYLNFVDALEEMKCIQPEGYDPAHPSEGCNREFFDSVRRLFPSGGEDLRYYIAVGTKMDFFHGVDAIFVYQNGFVTIDVTVDPNKQFKANFCIRPEDVESGRVYTEIASDIVELLLRKNIEST